MRRIGSDAEVGQWLLLAAFAGLAVVAGPLTMLVSNPLYFGLPWPTPWSSAVASVIAGIVLLGWCVARSRPLLRAREWVVLAVLLVPEWVAGGGSALPLHETGWGVMLLLGLAAPLWLALLSALQLIRVEVPRATVGAAIAGIGAVCLMTPVGAYSVAVNQVPMLLVHLVVSVATVYTWTYAAPRLAHAGAIACAGSFLLLEGLTSFAASRLVEAIPAEPVDWRVMGLSLMVHAAVLGCYSFLWFWLLRRMTLAAFCMSALAIWTASALPGVWLGFAQWRVAVAPAIGLAAVVVGVRARMADEQPTVLGLRET